MLGVVHVLRLVYAGLYIAPQEKITVDVLFPMIALNAVLLSVLWWTTSGIKGGTRIVGGCVVSVFFFIGWLTWLGFILQEHYPFTVLVYVIEGAYIVLIVITICLLVPLLDKPQ